MPPAAPRLAVFLTTFFAMALAISPPAVAQADELQNAQQLLKQGQLDRAMERVDAFLKSRPKDARGRFLRGLILTEQKKPAEAIKVFTALTHEYPELPEPYNNLAVLYAAQGEYDKARAALEMAIRTHPSYATAHENLGDIYAKMASQAYDRALQLDKGNAPLQTKLNLINDLFSTGPQPPRVSAAAKPAPAKVAVAPAPAKPAEAAKAPPAKEPAAAGAAPAPAQPPAKPAARPQRNADEVLKAVGQWARAWSENDVAAYLAHYAPGFETPGGEAREAWEAQRRARIAKPRRIQVEIESPRVTFNDDGRATVNFRQHYRSETFKATSNKTLVMIRSGDRWLIQQERVGG
jgi:tetratricopeptide (TPR) repeat protein